MNKRLLISFFVLFFICILPNALFASSKELYEKAAKEYNRLFQDEKIRKFEHNWLKTINKFDHIYKKYPHSIHAVKSLFNIAHLYRSLYKWNAQEKYILQSNSYFETLLKRYPKSYLADDSLYELGSNQEIYLNNDFKAYQIFQKFIKSYPKSEFILAAKDKLKRITIPQDLLINKTNTKKKPASKTGGRSTSKNVLVKKIEHYQTDAFIRIVINTNDAVLYRYQELKDKFYVDVLNSYITPEFKRLIKLKGGIIKQLRIAQFNKSVVRIVFDLLDYKAINIFDFQLKRQSKIIIDIKNNDKKGWGFALKEKNNAIIKKQASTIAKQKKKNQASTPTLSLSDAFGLKVRTIVLDAGHGGKDPGAIGFGLQEKKVNLTLIKKLEKIIKQRHSDIRVLKTRDSDKFLKLEERTAFANKNKADLFISVHANASTSKKLHGIETYFLNLTQDKRSLTTAARENRSSLKNISDLQSILNDLLTSTKIEESSELAGMVQNSIYHHIHKKQTKRVKNLGVKQAPFLVLVGSEMPSILVEVGFLTNKEENNRLKKDAYLNELALGIYAGIKKYINRVESGYQHLAVN